ncbi:MAG: hypothetical protein NTV49_14820, partial [Kiritimatiellaeota bacterium]|nr:hypothetical protein [Kiritimatiellota bacterium]
FEAKNHSENLWKNILFRIRENPCSSVAKILPRLRSAPSPIREIRAIRSENAAAFSAFSRGESAGISTAEVYPPGFVRLRRGTPGFVRLRRGTPGFVRLRRARRFMGFTQIEGRQHPAADVSHEGTKSTKTFMNFCRKRSQRAHRQD